MAQQGAAQPGESASRSALVVATLALCGTVVSLQQTLVLPLLPEFPRLLDTSVENASWLVTATLLSGAVSIPTVSRLADMFGKKRMMVVALAVMVAGSFVGAFTTAVPLMIIARAMQGVGMALVPVGIAIMRDELPRERVPLGVALMSGTLAIGAGAGLPLSGVIAENVDWHVIFWVTGAAGSAMLAAVVLVVSESPVRTRGSFDYTGAALLTVALTAVLLAVSKGGQWGWASGPTIAAMVLGLVLLAAWVPVELHARNPLIDVRVASRSAVLLVNIVAVFSGFAMFANMLITTQLLQLPADTGYGQGLDVLDTGLWMAPSALVFGAMAPVSAWTIRRLGAQATLLYGVLIMAVAYATRVYFSLELWHVVAGSIVVGVGTSMAFAAMPTLIMRAVPVTETASAIGLNTLLRSVGTSTSSAAVAAAASIGVIAIGDQLYPSFDALKSLLWLAAAVSFVAGLVVLPTFRMTEYDEDPIDGGHMQDAVVRGRVVSNRGPVRNAVVTLLTADGEQIDWSQVDSAGDYALAVPYPGRYVLVTAAEGWTPVSTMTELSREADIEPIMLSERLALGGTITDGAEPIGGAVLVLTRQSGEAVCSARTGYDGRYEVPLPPNGRYVLTAVTPAGATIATALNVWGSARTVDIEIPDGDDEFPQSSSATPRETSP